MSSHPCLPGAGQRPLYFFAVPVSYFVAMCGLKFLTVLVYSALVRTNAFYDALTLNEILRDNNLDARFGQDKKEALDNVYSNKGGIDRSDPGPDWVKKVHIVSMNHLDVGYDGIPGKQSGFINNVLHYYFHEYFPRAVQLGNDLKEGGYTETFIYTTHPWLVSLYLDCPPNFVLGGIKLLCPNHTEVSHFTKAITDGYITWHAGPMNLEPEFAPSTLAFEYGLDIGLDLDKRFGISRPTRVLSQRDVPGMTQTVIPILARKGVTGVTVGVNNMTPPPAVHIPPVFRWRYGNDEVFATWHAGMTQISYI